MNSIQPSAVSGRRSETIRAKARRWILPFLFGVAAVAAAAADWEAVAERRAIAGNPDLHESVWRTKRPPGGAYDRISVHRYAADAGKDGANVPRKVAFLYLPGTNMNGELALKEEKYNLWLYLARRGMDVYTLDYRTHFVPAAVVSDFSFMAGWTTGAFLEDIAEAVRLVKKTSGAEKLVLGGFSRGVTLAYFYASQRWKEDLCGLVMLDGGVKNPYAKNEHNLEKALASLAEKKNFASDVGGSLGWEKRQALMQAVIRDPDGPALDTIANTGASSTVGKQLEAILYRAWRPGGLANTVDGFSRGRVLAQLLIGYDRYYPQVQSLEMAAAQDYADHPGLPFDDHLRAIDVPLIAFQSSGMGAPFLVGGLYSAGLIASKDLTLHLLEGYGHLDVLVGERAQEEVFAPLTRWFQKRQNCPPAPASSPIEKLVRR